MTWASEVGWITGATGTISGDIAELFVLYDGLNMSVIDLTNRVIVLEGEVLSINGTLAALPDLSGYTQLVFDVSDLQSRVGVLEAGFAALPDLSGYPTLLADVAQLKLDVAAIQATLAGLPDLSGYSALVAEVGSLRDDLTALQGTVAALPDLSGYGALVTQVGDHETRIGALESWRAVDEPEIAQLRDDVDALIGGGGGGGGGGGATVVHLKYPDDFTAVFWPAVGLVEVAEVGPAVGDTEVAVFVYGDTANAGPVYIVAKERAAGDKEYPLRVMNGRASAGNATRLLISVPNTASLGVSPSRVKAVFGGCSASLMVRTGPVDDIVSVDGYIEIADIQTHSIHVSGPMTNDASDPWGPYAAGTAFLFRKRMGKQTFLRVRAVFVEGDASDVDVASISVNAYKVISTPSYLSLAGGSATPTIPAGSRTYLRPANETFTGWAQLFFADDEPSYLARAGILYSSEPATPLSNVHILVEIGHGIDKINTGRYDDIY